MMLENPVGWFAVSVKSTSPFLTGFSAHLFGSAKRRMQETIAKRRRELTAGSLGGLATQFQDFLPPWFLDRLSETRRKRSYCNVVTLWAWIGQIIGRNSSCSEAVSQVRAWYVNEGLEPPSGNTTAYCNARKRLPSGLIASANERLISIMENRVASPDLWHGLVVKSVDGSSVQLMDTPENQAAYPQPGEQKEGCGFPVMKFLGILNHSHGAWDAHITAHPTEHDSKSVRRLIGHFGPGELLLADRAFCSYELTARLLGRGTHSVMRLHQMREKGFTLRKGKRIGPNERLVTWTKPQVKPAGSDLDDAQWALVPASMQMRCIAFWYEDREGAKRRMVLVTTLLNPMEYNWLEIAGLYYERWQIELRLRDVKTTLAMESLNVKSPEMARKTLAMALLGFNLIKAASQLSAKLTATPLKLISFKGALDTLKSMAAVFMGHAGRGLRKLRELHRKTAELISTKLLDIRPLRWEPRMKKKRPKPFPLLIKPRRQYKNQRSSGAANPA